MSTPKPITALLTAAGQGDAGAQDQLWALVYDELHALAQRQAAGEPPGRSPQATTLVQMAYVRLVDGGREICVSSTDLDLKKPCDNPLTSLSGNIDPAWSPDGRMIVFSSLRDGNEELYVMTVTGAGQRNITASPSRDRQPDWQPVPGGATGF
jgi:Tol biopolymer transport system component